MDGFWEFVDSTRARRRTRTAPASCSWSPSSETDAQAEEDYAEHIKYFYDKCLHIPPNYLGAARPPGLPEPGEHGIRTGIRGTRGARR